MSTNFISFTLAAVSTTLLPFRFIQPDGPFDQLNGLYSSRQRRRDQKLVKERIWVHFVGLRLGELGVEVAIVRYVLTRLFNATSGTRDNSQANWVARGEWGGKFRWSHNRRLPDAKRPPCNDGPRLPYRYGIRSRCIKLYINIYTDICCSITKDRLGGDSAVA